MASITNSEMTIDPLSPLFIVLSHHVIINELLPSLIYLDGLYSLKVPYMYTGQTGRTLVNNR
jgi:hypothetical protein